MAIDLSSLPTDVNQISNIIMVNPQQNIGIRPQPLVDFNQGSPSILQTIIPKPSESFLFHIPTEDKASVSSDITDHYTEDNTALQDQISLKPVKLTLSGFIGELNNVTPAALLPLRTAADRLTTIGAYAPVLSTAAIRAYNQAAQVYSAAITAANAATSVFDSVAGVFGRNREAPQTQQQKAFTRLYALWKARQLFTVQTPWAIFNDMAIESMTATQNEDTRMISEFEITFKQMRFASTILTASEFSQAGRAGAQASKKVSRGKSKPVESIAAVDAFSRGV